MHLLLFILYFLYSFYHYLIYLFFLHIRHESSFFLVLNSEDSDMIHQMPLMGSIYAFTLVLFFFFFFVVVVFSTVHI